MPRSAKLARTLIAGALLVGGLLVTNPAPADAAVRTCSSSTPVSSRPTLRRGDTGSCVRVLQQALVAKGYSVGSYGADGSFGQATDTAARRFQHDHAGLAIDGIVGQGTWGVLVNGGAKYSISSGANRTSAVVLSFDDCPTSLASFRAAVDGSERAGVALALFPTGNCLQTGRFDVAYARAHGHYVFNHSVSHPDLTTVSASNAYYQLGAPGVVTSYGRPPYGAYNTNTVRNAYAQRSMRIWTWHVDTRDWEGKSQASIVSQVSGTAKAGQTVLMHMQWNAFNESAIKAMKSGLSARGLAVCRNRGATAVRPASMNC